MSPGDVRRQPRGGKTYLDLSQRVTRALHGQAGHESLAISAGHEPPGRDGSGHQVRAALGGVPPPKRLSEEISELGKQLDRLVAEAASEPLAMNGVSIDTAASLLITAGDHPERPRNGGDYLLGAETFPPERLPAGVPEGKDRVGRREAPAPRGDFPVMAKR